MNEVVFSIVPHPPTHDIITEADKRRIPILSESLESDQQMYGTSLHDELLCVPALSSSGPSAPSTVGNSLASRAWTIPSSKDSSFERDNGASFSSSVGTEYSDVIMQSLDTALKNAMKNYDEDMELERTRNDSFNARFYELTEAEQTPSPQQESSPLPETNSTSNNILKKATEITEIPINQTEELQEENEPIVIEQDTLDSTDEYGIPRNLLALLTKIPTEKGLDAQEFRCPSCRKSIGGSFSSFKLCNLDCRYYCEECWKRGDESLIPARLILNWDTRPRPISKASKAFLKSIADRPLIRIDKMNSRLYQHSKQMDKILQMREKLSLVAMYLLSCKQSVADDLKRRLWPNHYLYSDIHLYSVTDLQNVTTGVLERRLNMVITSAIAHINSCALCLQKGFICEICSSKKVIYPFQMDIAFRCTKCFAVFHIKCIEKQECPKCLRRAKYSFRSNEEMDGSTLPLE
uniref:Rubicon Homology domain-containing protein n=1 Tax=Acrobeloides nanus TaxID=290746 RepID=A0A914DBQ9_9BILA